VHFPSSPSIQANIGALLRFVILVAHGQADLGLLRSRSDPVHQLIHCLGTKLQHRLPMPDLACWTLGKASISLQRIVSDKAPLPPHLARYVNKAHEMAVSQVLCLPYCKRLPASYRNRSHLTIGISPIHPFGSFIPAGRCPDQNLGCSLMGFTSFHLRPFEQSSSLWHFQVIFGIFNGQHLTIPSHELSRFHRRQPIFVISCPSLQKA
jgi:hypothetical protein